MTSELDIPLDGFSVNIVRKCGAALNNALFTKFGCRSVLNGVDFERESSITQHRHPTVSPEKRFVATLSAGVQVSVWKADLTAFKADAVVDAVVNAANTALQHRGGLAKALSTVGGPQIQQESNDYIRKNSYLKTGDAVVLNAGLLPYRKIIHAVGPDLPLHPTNSEVANAENLLKKVICNILDRVAENHLKTVALPAISSGLFNYPLPKCADAIVSTVKKYYEQVNPHSHLPKEIFLVNNDEPTVREIERACHQILVSAHPKLYSQAAASNTRGAAKHSSLTVQLEKVLLTLKTDKIEEQHADVIVNTASKDRRLINGQISRAIFEKAGSGIQNEIMNAHAKGHIVITESYNLKCKKVYHTFCMEKWKDAHKAPEILFNSVSECLWSAVGSSFKSIAFPAIGTGQLGFSKPEAANIMLNAVAQFAQNSQSTIEVHLVIFPNDRSTFEAFEEAMRGLQQNVSRSNFEPAFESRGEFHSKRAAVPHISLRGVPESTAEAEKWLRKLFDSSSSVKICNNFILHFGKKEYQHLSRFTEARVFFEEFFSQGHACMEVKGHSKEEAVIAALQVENMLCNIQKEFICEEERELHGLLTEKVSFERQEVDPSSQEFSDWFPAFERQGLRVLKAEKVENSALKTLFDLKKKQLHSSNSQKMFQCIPAQFCEMVSHIGFHAVCAPPEDSYCGEGIYFARTIKAAMELWRERRDKYLYFVAADVLTGKSIQGARGLILPSRMYDSVCGEPDISVIFSGYQALPKYIITCTRE